MSCAQALRLLTLPLLLLVGARSAAATPELESLEPAIDGLATPQAEAGLFSGVILVADGDAVLFERAYGFAVREQDLANTPESQFGIASVTKPMTEVLVYTLAGEGRLDVGAPVERYLPGFPRGPEGGRPTLRDLLDHRAGVPHRVTTPAEEAGGLEAADIVQRVIDVGLLFEPGTERLYSSAGYTCLARVVEIVEGKPFWTVLEEQVFGPAAMDSAQSGGERQPVPVRALPYRLGAEGRNVVVKRAAHVDFGFLTGAGSVFATAEDLLHFVHALRGGVFGDDIAASAFGDPAEWQGWAGWTNGYEAYVDVLPAEDLVLVLLSNLRSAANWQLREQVQNLLTGDPVTRIVLPPPVAEPFEEPKALVGTYGPAEITRMDNALFRGDNEFYPVEGGKYYVPASGSTMRFRRNAAGEIDAVVSIRGDGSESVLPRNQEPAHVD